MRARLTVVTKTKSRHRNRWGLSTQRANVPHRSPVAITRCGSSEKLGKNHSLFQRCRVFPSSDSLTQVTYTTASLYFLCYFLLDQPCCLHWMASSRLLFVNILLSHDAVTSATTPGAAPQTLWLDFMLLLTESKQTHSWFIANNFTRLSFSYKPYSA